MARPESETEYVITQDAYQRACDSLPPTGTPGQTAPSVAVRAKEYRLNVSNTINAGKWVMWAIVEQPIVFTWSADGQWKPPVNVVVRPD